MKDGSGLFSLFSFGGGLGLRLLLPVLEHCL